MSEPEQWDSEQNGLVVIPMLGRGVRFLEAGYSASKQFLPAGQWSVFQTVLESFRKWFDVFAFRFVCPSQAVADRVALESQELGLIPSQISFRIVPTPTKGQAESVMRGLRGLPNSKGPLIIHNVDTALRDFEIPRLAEGTDGWIQVFRGKGEHWSFVAGEQIAERDGEGTIGQVREKERISPLCSSGLYGFRDAHTFEQLFLAMRKKAISELGGELFVAPMFQIGISQGMNFRYHEVPPTSVISLGTPNEYELSRHQSLNMPPRRQENPEGY